MPWLTTSTKVSLWWNLQSTIHGNSRTLTLQFSVDSQNSLSTLLLNALTIVFCSPLTMYWIACGTFWVLMLWDESRITFLPLSPNLHSRKSSAMRSTWRCLQSKLQHQQVLRIRSQSMKMCRILRYLRMLNLSTFTFHSAIGPASTSSGTYST